MDYVASAHLLTSLRPFLPPVQFETLRQMIWVTTEEHKFFRHKVAELAKRIEQIPAIYAQDGKGDEAVVYLHYFRGEANYWVTEIDRNYEPRSIEVFGLANLFGGVDDAELGYFDIAELVRLGFELDLYFEPRTLAQLRTSSGDTIPLAGSLSPCDPQP